MHKKYNDVKKYKRHYNTKPGYQDKDCAKLKERKMKT